MRRAAVAIAILLSLCAILPTTTARVDSDTPLAVTMTYREGDYDIGSVIEFQAHVFYKGEYYDPDSVTFDVSANDLILNKTRTAEGRFEARMQISRDDLSTYGYLTVYVDVTDYGPYGGSVSDGVSIRILYISRSPSFIVDLVVPEQYDQYPVPGQRIEYEVHMTFGGDYVEPDPGTIESYCRDSDGVNRPIVLDERSTGLYDGSYTIPSTVRVSTSLRITVSAEFTNGSDYDYDYDSYWIYIDFFEVWAHYVNSTPSWAEMEIYVTDPDNLPVNEVTVHLTYKYYKKDESLTERTASAITDAEGKVHLVLDYPNMHDLDDRLRIEGYATDGTHRQTFYESVQVKKVDSPWVWPWLDVKILNELPLAPGTTVDLRLVPLWNGAFLTDQEVYLYIEDDHNMYVHTTGVPDHDGVLTVQFNTPSLAPGEGTLRVALYMQTFIEGNIESVYGYFYIGNHALGGDIVSSLDPMTKLTVEPFQLGGEVDITLSHPDADGVGEIGMVLWWLNGPDGRQMEWGDEWASWSESFDQWGARMYPCIWRDGAFQVTFNFPQFLPENATVTFVGVVVFEGDGDDEEDMRATILEGVVPLPRDPRPELDCQCPQEGGGCGGVTEVRGTSTGPHDILWVDLKLDGGFWERATGTSDWTYQLDTTAMESGPHFLHVRCFDGRRYSEILKVQFVVDQCPSVDITWPEDGTRLGGLVRLNGTATDSEDVLGVEYSIDGSAWTSANGGELWNIDLDTTSLDPGEHMVTVQCLDAFHRSPEVSVTFVVDQNPLVSIDPQPSDPPSRASRTFTGSASDDHGVEAIEVRIDGGNWRVIMGGDQWSYEASTETLSEGAHTFEVRSYDGFAYSEVELEHFVLREEDDNGPAFGAVFALVGLVAAAGIARAVVVGRRR